MFTEYSDQRDNHSSVHIYKVNFTYINERGAKTPKAETRNKLNKHTGFAWQCFGNGEGGYRAGSVRHCQKVLPRPTESVPAGSKTDLLLAKDKPISNSGNISGIAYFRKEKKLLHDSNCSQKRGVTIGERNFSADKIDEEGGGGGAPDARAEIPVVKAMVRQVVTLQPMDIHSGAEIHLKSVEDPTPAQVNARRL
ncbi:hypothetical protein WISP_145109 [Willisornis vidua]|uniref:Uncharacterized protein n=1 Tax=Willisornis vidua TaxID=1566151 RepID=A0ABQ9CQG2_9PASS|nr:hypothetical protein WISP_145109 [Willisornis vidua]